MQIKIYFLVFWPLFLGTTFVQADGIIPVGQALTVIKSFENAQIEKIKNAQWSIRITEGDIPKNGEIDDLIPKIKNKNHFYENKVVFEPLSKRYRVDEEGVTKWIDGDGDNFAYVQQFSFDGATERSFRRGQGGIIIPKENLPANGLIRKEKGNDFLEGNGQINGIAYFPPFHFGMLFSDFIQNKINQKQKVEITNNGGIWIILTTPQQASLASDSDFRIAYDTKSGLVLWAEWVGKQSLEPNLAGKVWKRHLVKWKQIVPDTWVPERYTQCNLINGTGTRFDFMEISINKNLKDEVFRISFPIGTRLRDEIEKKSYVVSNGIVDEQEAIRQFMAEQAIYDTQNSGKNFNYWWIVLASCLIGIICLGLFFKRKKSLLASSFILILFGKSFSAEPDNLGNWRVKPSSGESYSISQCGLNVTVFSLEYFQVKYNIKHVSLGLPPTEEGISCLDIKSVLQSHGLDVVARDKVTFSELKRVIKPGILAIFPTKLENGWNHFLIATVAPSKGLIVIDPPNKITNLNESLKEEQFASLGGLVLFIRKSKDTLAMQNTLVDVTPKDFNLGIFAAGTAEYSKPLKRIINIKNKAKKPVLVSSIISPCGCLQVKWDGGVIKEGHIQEIPLIINPGGWGWGDVQRTVSIIFADGTEEKVTLNASTPKPEKAQKIEIESDIIRFDIPYNIKDSTLKKSLPIAFNPGGNFPKVICKTKWLLCKFQSVSNGQGELIFDLDARNLPEPPYPISEELRIFTDDDQNPVVVKVVVSRPGWCTPEPAVLQCKKGKQSSLNLKLNSLGKSFWDENKEIYFNELKGIKIEIDTKSESEIKIIATCEQGIPDGIYEVLFRLGKSNTAPSIKLPLYVE